LSASIVLAGVAVFVALGGSAMAAGGLVVARDIATGAVTSRSIKDGSVALEDLSPATQVSLRGAVGPRGETGLAGSAGATGSAGSTGSSGANGVNGANGSTGAAGSNGAAGSSGAAGSNGANGPNGLPGTNGANGTNGTDGIDGAAGSNGAAGSSGAAGSNGANGPNGLPGTNGANGTNGTDGIDGADGVLGPLSATQGTTLLPTASPPVVVASLNVPAGNYVVFGKTQLTHSGAGDTINCTLKADNTTIDQVAMKTLPALAAIPMSMQAITTTSPTLLTIECKVQVADGSASSSSLIALPVG
jgi:hypothetical protein